MNIQRIKTLLAEPNCIMNIFNLFPTPVGFVGGVLTEEERNKLIDQVENCDQLLPNQNSDQLTHTGAVDTLKGPHIDNLCEKLSPHIRDFGFQLMGDDSLNWNIIGLWGNIMKKGGWQYKHNHGNSVMSGVVYLQMPENAPATRFWRKERGDTFFLGHDGPGRTTDYNSEYIDLKNVKAGDIVLFPSYLTHSVEESGEGDRITLAFNVVPDRINILDTYYLKLSS